MLATHCTSKKLKTSKVEDPTTCNTFLGITIDHNTMQASISNGKLLKALQRPLNVQTPLIIHCRQALLCLQSHTSKENLSQVPYGPKLTIFTIELTSQQKYAETLIGGWFS